MIELVSVSEKVTNGVNELPLIRWRASSGLLWVSVGGGRLLSPSNF